jgi:hypothetical protein
MLIKELFMLRKLNRRYRQFSLRAERFFKSPLGLGAMAVTLFTVGSILLAPPARADFKAEIKKVQDISKSLQDTTAGMTEVAILPIGISSSIKILRHVVLNNV